MEIKKATSSSLKRSLNHSNSLLSTLSRSSGECQLFNLSYLLTSLLTLILVNIFNLS